MQRAEVAKARGEAPAPPRPAHRKQPAQRRGPGRPTRAQVDEHNAALLNHVMEQLLEKGFEGVNIREVVQTVGMAKRTLVGRFGNKAQLCKAALERAVDEWAVPVSDLRALETPDIEETLYRVASRLVASYISPQGMRIARVTNAEAYRMPEISSYVYRQCTEPLIAYFTELFRRHCDPAELPDAQDYALSLLNLVGTPSRLAAWGIRQSAEDIERQIRHTVRLFLHGLPLRTV